MTLTGTGAGCTLAPEEWQANNIWVLASETSIVVAGSSRSRPGEPEHPSPTQRVLGEDRTINLGGYKRRRPTDGTDSLSLERR